MDISGAIATKVGNAGLSYLAVLAYTTPSTQTDHILGLRFAYDPTLPDSVATLGANTFSGTQTAPAFVGDGSSLTNIPPGPVDRAASARHLRRKQLAFTTVRIFNNSGSDQAIIMDLFSSSSGVLLAECINQRLQNRQTIDWCIQPSDFGADRFATLRLRPSGGGFQGSNAVSAFVTKFAQ